MAPSSKVLTLIAVMTESILVGKYFYEVELLIALARVMTDGSY
jgi:hypothetical protein